MLEKGRVVRSLAGRDKGYLLVVLQTDGKRALLCDGKERPVSRPKSKNIRHIEPTDFLLTSEEMRSDRALKKAIGRIIRENGSNI